MLKKLTIENSLNQKITGILHINQSKTLLIIVPGYRGTKEYFGIKELALQLSKKYSVFRYDSTDDINVVQQEKNLNSIVSFFKPKFDTIILIGTSLGALVSIMHVNKNKEINKLIIINGFFYFWGLRWKDLKIVILTFLTFPFSKISRQILIHYYKNLKPKNINVPILLICGRNDERINFKQSQKFYNSVKNNKNLVILDNIDHGLTKKEFVVDVSKKIIEWLK